MLGQTYDVQPLPPDIEHTVYLDAGPLSIGVEYRVVDPEALSAAYEGDDLAEIEAHSPEGGFSDEGLSIHVIAVADQHEYLRFDAFDDEPHYHYVDRSLGTNTVVGFDEATNGPMLPWVLSRLRHRLDPMLRRAGAAHVADALPPGCGAVVAGLVEEYLPAVGVQIPTPGEDAAT
ncbi:MAG: DUF7700 domain-containing protein [Microthrixaceae bacterium]